MQKRKKKLAILLMAGLLLSQSMTALAVTNISGCSRGGSVVAEYETAGSAKNGYYLSSGNIIIKYEKDTSKEQCSDAKWEYIGATDAASTPNIQGNHVGSGSGHRCNGHTSPTAQWAHYMGVTGTTLYGLKSADKNSLVLTESQYDKAKYVVTGPLRTHGNGLTSDGRYPWVGQFQTLPAKSAVKEGQTDREGPVITTTITPAGTTAVAGNGKKYGTKAILAAKATDNKSRPAKTNPFRWYKGSTALSGGRGGNADNAKTASANLEVTENATYYVEATDQLGNTEKSKAIPVDCIDVTAPTCNVSGVVNDKIINGGREWTATSVTLSAQASDAGVGLANTAYCFDGSTWIAQNTYKVFQNGTYQIKVRDALGNTIQKSITVQAFDRSRPNVTIQQLKADGTSLEEGEWVNSEVTVSVTAEDLESGLPEKPYSYDNGETWTEDETFCVKENEFLTVLVRDRVMNIMQTSVDVCGIDTIPPEILEVSKHPIKWEKEKCDISVTARDNENGSGLAEMPYSFDGGLTWKKENSHTVLSDTTLQIAVKDNANNIINKAVEVKKEVKEKEPEEEEEKKKEKVKKKKKKKKQVKEKNKPTKPKTEHNENTILPQPQPVPTNPKIPIKKKITNTQEPETEEKKEVDIKEKEKVVEETEEVKEVEETLEQPLPQPEQKQLDNKDKVLKICIGAIIFMILAGLLGILLWYFLVVYKYRVTIYGKVEDGWKKIGRLFITSKEEEYMIHIPDHYLHKVSTIQYKIVLTNMFVKEHQEEDIYLYLEERSIQKSIQKEIEFTV